jgi:hypothetical protein
MKLVRSWPANIPEGRSYVVDDIERFVMGADNDTQFDYRRLVDYDDDIVLIEWDIAVGGEQLRTFIDRARAEPDRVRVAPYLLYRGGRDGKAAQVPFYVHRIREPGMRTWVKGPDDTYCHLFGFGLIYLPKDLIAGFVAQLPAASKFGDTEFSRWHARQPIGQRRNVPIDWDCHAVHLHYLTPEVR